jgi:hypothetical protein
VQAIKIKKREAENFRVGKIKKIIIMGTFYKYRNFTNFKHFVDIILNNRLYAAHFRELSDPMEGHFKREGEPDETIRDLILSDKSTTRICSLSRTPDNDYLWQWYADHHRGMVVEVELADSYQPKDIIYVSDTYGYNYKNYNHDTAEDILSHKFEEYNKEEEVRIFEKPEHKTCPYIKVDNITKIITGKNMTKEDVDFIKKLVGRINSEIKVSPE